MKTRLLKFVVLVAALSSFTAFEASAVPTLMSYQGRVTDADGILIGADAPVNRTVIFRLYTEATGGAAIYAETQVVTISGGEFSVLIGNGTGISGEPGPSAPAASPFKTINEVINSAGPSPLYLGITIDDGNSGTESSEIAPRQQLVSGAFAVRAGMAESVAAGAVTSAMLGDSSVATGNIQTKAINSSKIADGGVSTLNIANSAITIDKLNTDQIGVWTPNGNNVYRSGNVGIGQANPGFPLNFANSLGDKIALYGNTGNHYGLGIQSSLLQIYTNGSGADIAFGYGNSTAMTETMRIKGSGNVGIGTSTPSAKLHVAGGNATIENTGSTVLSLTRGTSSSTRLAQAGSAGQWSASAATDDAVFRSDSGKIHLQSGAGSAALTINTANNVGIGNSNPGVPLSFADVLGDKIALHSSNSGNHFGFGIQGSLLQIYTTGSSSDVAFGYGNSASMTETMRVKGNGRVSIGTNNTGQGILNVGGAFVSVGSRDGSPGYARMYYENAGRVVFEGYNTYLNNGQWRGFSMDGNNDLDWRSDARLKENVEDAEPMLDRLMQVKFRRYNWINSDEEQKEFGVIAQELRPLFPDLVGEDAEGYLTVGYTSFATIASKALQELKHRTDAEIEALKAEMEEKDSRIADLEARLAALEALIRSAR